MKPSPALLWHRPAVPFGFWPILLLLLIPVAPVPVRGEEKPTPKPEWQNLFDGKTLKGWETTDFAGHGEVRVDPDFKGAPAIILDMGAALTGITFTNEPPKTNYEISVEAMRVDGSDFFCGLTFPVGDSFCSLIAGGWGGGIVGISSVDGMDASENETTQYRAFENGKWYAIRVRVTPERIEAWLDDERVVSLETKDRRLSVRYGEIELSQPLGLATWQTTAAFRQIRLRHLD